MKSADDLPQPVRELLECHIDSIEKLEVLLILHGGRDRGWTTRELTARFNRPVPIGRALQSLKDCGLAQTRARDPDAQHVYEPANPALDEAATALVRAYRDHPIAVIRFMSANAIERLRRSAMRAFSDAFVSRNRKG